MAPPDLSLIPRIPILPQIKVRIHWLVYTLKRRCSLKAGIEHSVFTLSQFTLVLHEKKNKSESEFGDNPCLESICHQCLSHEAAFLGPSLQPKIKQPLEFKHL
ncbi:hypothetical protein M514_04668 [Trichuris suis]|uniref:Uncharacterized protein n=1 Tax=Trichuris suis TaxID=68888 RepID=A0A085N3U2_9BILA|nr:hypothetical protein M513_04668 [Trichuris suis]KFD64138.1 hypothetical protein M514_04668 [Trichuris suis]